LRKRLRECGWREQLRNTCKDIIREKGLDKVTVDYLVAEITPKARASVPEQVKRELLQEIRDFLQSTP
jgi:enhancer of yellow 2 transcription factor